MEITLINLKSGENAIITRDYTQGWRSVSKKTGLFKHKGWKNHRKITEQPFDGPVVIGIDNTEA